MTASHHSHSLPPTTDVLVIGGGLTGLATAALLARQGVQVLLVEQHAGTSIHPKARLVNARTMEIYRALGIEERVLD
ncbi:MAG: FAD-dependent monooxygenase, partial [Actinomycetia bacterium]|nr:FAD-dependent monooxygenase [Actinomycetes bacterium]